ncbi:Spy/CpxP family protein refolding chaperone [Desulfoluna butyratoxydans]|nr:periplasmic heavy metal sensor [Desulfoluna butyratoxydans]
MKKVITAVAATLLIGFFAASAYAWGCGGHGYGGGMHGNGYYNQSGDTNGAYTSFMNDTQTLRSSISANRAELNALMAGTNPDPKKARALSEKISQSESELRAKAQQHNIARGMGSWGYNQGWNCGINSHNHTFAGCW